MTEYSAALSSAQSYAAEGKLDVWIHLYLNREGRNPAFSDGLKLTERYYFSPVWFPLWFIRRCAGPEPGMKYRIDKDWWISHVSDLEKSIQNDTDMPPLLVSYVNGKFVLNDGNHRYQAYQNLGAENVPVIVWITEEADYESFLAGYGDYVKDCVIIRK